MSRRATTSGRRGEGGRPPAAAPTDPQAEVAAVARILRCRPTDRDALRRLARLGAALGDPAGEEQVLRRLVDAWPGDVDAWLALAASLRRQGRGDEAAAACDQALLLRPAAPDVRLEKVLAEEAAGRFEAASGGFDALVAEFPGFPRIHLERHYFLMRRGDVVAALAAADRMIAAHAGEPLGWVARAAALHHLERFAEADRASRRAIGIRPDCAPAHFERGVNLMRMGDWRRGLAEMEWRHRLPDAPLPPAPLPQATLDDPPGTRVLLWSDQGLGDALQYLRFIPGLRERGLRPLLHLPRTLARLAQTIPGVESVTVDGKPPAADRQIGLCSLPWLLRLDGPDGTWNGPYLSPPDGLRLDRRPGLAVGVVWAGSPRHTNDRNRSMAAGDLAPLFDLAGIAWYSLQLGRPGEARPSTAVDLAPLINDLADTAGLLTQLDLLVSVDTSICHLAGALGVPAWVLLPPRIEWRWTPGDGATAWDPSWRLFRQRRAGDWSAPGAAVREGLAHLATVRAAGGGGVLPYGVGEIA